MIGTRLPWLLLLLLAAFVDYAAALEGCEHGVDMAFVVDTSRSMTKEEFDLQMNFVMEMSAMFKIGPEDTQISVLQYAHRLHQLFCFNDFKDNLEVMKAIHQRHRYFRGSTRTSKAFKRLRKRIFNKKCGMRDPSIRVAILLTDGMPDYANKAIEEAKLLQEHGVIVVTIGIGNDISMPMLHEFSSAPELAFRSTDFFQLDLIRPHVAMEACRKINPHLEEVMPQCHIGADLLFIIDHSRSLAEVNHMHAMDFVESFARNFMVSEEDFHTRVAMMHFSHRVYDHFCFHEFLSNVELSLAINHTSDYPMGSTNIYRAFKFAQKKMFTEDCGSRDGAFKIAVLVSDAKANFPWLAVKHANNLKASGVKVVTVGIGDIEERLLHPMSSSHDMVFRSMHEVNIEKITAHVSSGACEIARNHNKTWSYDDILKIKAHEMTQMHHVHHHGGHGGHDMDGHDDMHDPHFIHFVDESVIVQPHEGHEHTADTEAHTHNTDTSGSHGNSMTSSGGHSMSSHGGHSMSTSGGHNMGTSGGHSMSTSGGHSMDSSEGHNMDTSDNHSQMAGSGMAMTDSSESHNMAGSSNGMSGSGNTMTGTGSQVVGSDGHVGHMH